jgi:hypothetical protein
MLLIHCRSFHVRGAEFANENNIPEATAFRGSFHAYALVLSILRLAMSTATWAQQTQNRGTKIRHPFPVTPVVETESQRQTYGGAKHYREEAGRLLNERRLSIKPTKDATTTRGKPVQEGKCGNLVCVNGIRRRQ